MNVQHLSQSNEHYTPIEIIEASRNLMGVIQLDPASCRLANNNVKAEKYYSKSDDAINMNIEDWKAETLFLNPPGGCIKKDFNGKWVESRRGESSQAIWWDKLVEAYESGYVQEAIFLSFSLELIGKRGNSILNPNYFFCFTSGDIATSPIITKTGRTKFNKPVDGEIIVNPSPTHANLIVYLPIKSYFNINSEQELKTNFNINSEQGLKTNKHDKDTTFMRFNKYFNKFGVCRRFKIN